MDGRSVCLDGRDRVVKVVIAFEEVDVDGLRFNRIVWVDCDPAVPVP